jgi:hypothetical protein
MSSIAYSQGLLYDGRVLRDKTLAMTYPGGSSGKVSELYSIGASFESHVSSHNPDWRFSAFSSVSSTCATITSISYAICYSLSAIPPMLECELLTVPSDYLTKAPCSKASLETLAVA